MLIGVGQGGLLRRHRHAQMLQLPLATCQTAANLAQRMRPSQLAKQHRHELPPTGETTRVPLGLVPLHRPLELPAREQLQHLSENAAYFVHRLSPPEVELVLSRTPSSLSRTQPIVASGTPRLGRHLVP